jgi:hypothetical protein
MIINGWFEAVQTGTIVHLIVELNLTLVIAYLLFSLDLIFREWQNRTNHTDGSLGLSIGIITIFTVASIFSFQDDLKFYPKKLTQVFL